MKKVKLKDFALGKSNEEQQQAFKLGIVGCGSMGQEIALTASAHGIEVAFIDITDERIASIYRSLGDQLDVMIGRWGMTEGDKKAILSRIQGYVGHEVLRECSIVIEAVNTKKPVSSLDLRREIFQKIESIVPQETVIASNASTIVIDDLSIVLEHPERAIGLHFLSSVFSNKVFEVNKSWKTSEAAFELVQKFAKMIDKQIILINGTPGNVSTRILIPMINEACDMLMEGVSTVKEIDECMQLGFGLQLGPFSMADKIGLDKLVRWMEGLYQEFGDRKYKPSPIIKRMVRAGLFGIRNGEGFYIYENEVRKEKPGTIYHLGRK